MTIMDQIVTGKQIMDYWQLNEFELGYYTLKYDLTIVDRVEIAEDDNDSLVWGINTQNRIRILRDEIGSLPQCQFYVPEIEMDGNRGGLKLIDLKAGYFFNPDAGYYFCSLGTAPESLKEAIEGNHPEIKSSENVFKNFGPVWWVVYRSDEEALLVDQERYRYIAHLLSNSNDSHGDSDSFIYNTELIGLVKKKSFEEIYPEADVDSESISIIESDNLTKSEKDRIENIGYELLDALESAKSSGDSHSISAARDNFNKYQSHILNEYGIKSNAKNSRLFFGQQNRATPEFEKLRQNIKNQIRNAKKELKKHMPRLSKHLDRSITVHQYKTSYQPEIKIPWHVSL